MKLTILGYLGGYPSKGLGTTGYLIQTDGFNLLLDAGSGTLLELEKHIDPLELDAVVLTHYHQDHIADVGVLQYLWQLKAGNRKHNKLPIYGHFEDPLNFGSLTWPNATEGISYSEFNTLDLGELQLNFKKTIHPVPAFAVNILDKANNKRLGFTSDTTAFKNLGIFLQGVDLLITDTYFKENNDNNLRWHLTTKETADLFLETKAKKLLLSHLPDKIDHEEILLETKNYIGQDNGNVTLPEIGKQLEI